MKLTGVRAVRPVHPALYNSNAWPCSRRFIENTLGWDRGKPIAALAAETNDGVQPMLFEQQ